MPTVKTYDPKSFELAEYFMEDAPHDFGAPGMNKSMTDDFKHDLALHIQQVVEDWFEDRARNGWAPILEPVPGDGA